MPLFRNRQDIVAPALAVLAVVALVPMSGLWRPAAAEQASVVAPPAQDEPRASAPATEKAVLAGGCFWGVQGVFQHVKGVTSAVSGYSGGASDSATYPMVSTGTTGHAESVEITYDPSQVTYGQLLQIYFSVAHDPTQVDRQGPDVGTQYRSAIFTTDAEQVTVAKAYIAQLDKASTWPEPIATEVAPLSAFYPAEAYHQDFATLHPDHPYISFHDLPKMQALKQLFPGMWRDQPVLVGASS